MAPPRLVGTLSEVEEAEDDEDEPFEFCAALADVSALLPPPAAGEETG